MEKLEENSGAVLEATKDFSPPDLLIHHSMDSHKMLAYVDMFTITVHKSLSIVALLLSLARPL